MQKTQIASIGELSGEGLVIGIVCAQFNSQITSSLLAQCLEELGQLGVNKHDIKHVLVPGALEIPIILQAMAETDDFDALIALGCVIRGDTYHYEVVCDQSAAGLMQVALEYSLPVANGILTCENEQQAFDRLGKGREVAAVAISMANLLKGL